MVLNVGAGADDKREFIERSPRVRSYITLDYPSWEKNFRQLRRKSNTFGSINEILFRNTVRNPDIWGDGFNLPFLDNCIDAIISQGVLEHIKEPSKFLTEHYRTLKPNGILLMTTPLLYQAHGGSPAGRDDFVRFTEYGLKHILKQIGFSDITIQPYGFFGTALAQLINSFVIKSIIGKSRTVVYISAPFLAFIFFFVNLFGYGMNFTGKDLSYTAGFFVRAKAQKKREESVDNVEWEKLLRCPRCQTKLHHPLRCTHCGISFNRPKYGRVYMIPQ
jgi:SAM-dependent methyltransferase